MHKHQVIRRALIATIVSTALTLSTLAGGAASADGGIHTEALEVAHVGLKPSAPADGVTVKGADAAPAGASRYNDIALKPPVHDAP